MQPGKEKIIELVKNIQPMSDRVLILPDEEEKENEYGISHASLTNDSFRKQSGVVLCVGPGRQSDYVRDFCQHMDVRVGERVLFKKYAGDDLLFNENGTTEAHVGNPPRENQILITFVRQESIIAKL